MLKRFLWIALFQDKLVEKDFDIKAKASGVLKPFARSYNATVTNHLLEIRFHWAGKGTTTLPKRSVYGPLVSAISVNDPGECFSSLLMFFILTRIIIHPVILILVIHVQVLVV